MVGTFDYEIADGDLTKITWYIKYNKGDDAKRIKLEESQYYLANVDGKCEFDVFFVLPNNGDVAKTYGIVTKLLPQIDSYLELLTKMDSLITNWLKSDDENVTNLSALLIEKFKII